MPTLYLKTEGVFEIFRTILDKTIIQEVYIVSPGFIQASMSKIQGLFNDF